MQTRHCGRGRADRLALPSTSKRRAVRGVSPYDQGLEDYAIHLRLLVNSHARTTVEAARLKNRLRRLAHGIDPVLSGSTPWFTCLAHGKASPHEIVEWTAGQRPADMTAPQWARLQKFSALAHSENGYDPSQMKGNDAPSKRLPMPTPPKPITIA
jgi:hypothetical protein